MRGRTPDSGGRAGALLGMLFAALCGGGAWASPASSGRVAILEPSGAPERARHCLTRIQEELAAGGFEVVTVDPGPGRDPVSVAAAMERQGGAVAVVALVAPSDDPDQAGSELWILDRVGASPEVRRIPVPTGDREHLPEVLAIRTMEALKASALKQLIEAARPERPNRERTGALFSTAIPPPAAERARQLGIESGLSMLDSRGGPGPAALPVFRLRRLFGDFFFARITVAGLGTRPRVETPIGSASVAQSFGLGELGVALRPGRTLRPILVAGGGALYARTEGEGVWPYRGLQEARWAGAVEAGVGVMASRGHALSVTLEVDGLAAVPHPTVRFYNLAAATIGYPAVLAALTMVVWP